MNSTISPAVITSKAARDDAQNIMAQHTDILKNMAIQSQKVATYKQNKQAELQAQNTMKAEMDQAKMTADTAAKKQADDFALKQAQIDIQRSKLSAI